MLKLEMILNQRVFMMFVQSKDVNPSLILISGAKPFEIGIEIKKMSWVTFDSVSKIRSYI